MLFSWKKLCTGWKINFSFVYFYNKIFMLILHIKLFYINLYIWSHFNMCSRGGVAERNGSVSDAESEDENDEGDYTVYECPGFATVSCWTGSIAISVQACMTSKLFSDRRDGGEESAVLGWTDTGYARTATTGRFAQSQKKIRGYNLTTLIHMIDWSIELSTSIFGIKNYKYI